MDRKNRMYYITVREGQCKIKEIQPSNDDKSNHATIFEIKSSTCYGFNVSQDGKTFYFMDDMRVLNKLERMKDSNMLQETKELTFKDSDRPHFIKQSRYPNLIVNDKFLIQESKIFYLFEDENHLQKGILDMEELAEVKEKDQVESQNQYV